MCSMMKKHNGFTIVELLIVIVIIGILAAISIVTYGGISNQANDAAVKQDLAAIAKKVELWRVEKGTPPTHSPVTTLKELGINVSRSSYSQGFISAGTGNNLLYCRNSDQFALIAWSKSNTGFIVKDGSVSVFPYPPASMSSTCPRAGFPTTNYGAVWFYSAGYWQI